MDFSETVIAASVKPCIVHVIVLDILFKHALQPSTLGLDFTLELISCDFTSSQALFTSVVLINQNNRKLIG